MTYIITGPQGSGKGTQAKMLAKEFGIEHVSIGDVLRLEVANDTKLGKIVHSYMQEGKLIPLKINNEVVQSVLNKNRNIILDGYPRNKDQAEYLLANTKVEGVIVLKVSDDESINRISKRRICTANNKILIEGAITQKDRDECSALGGEIIKRDDDEPVAIKKRLQIYHHDTEPLMKLFREHNIEIIEVNGEKTILELFEEMKLKTQHLFEKKIISPRQ